MHFSDRVAEAIRSRGNPVCVGLDPRWDSLPVAIRRRHPGETLENIAAAYEAFCGRVLDLVAPLVPVVKPQSAFFETCGPAGMAALQRLLRRARDQGLLTILDGKRNDIASTAAAYADAAFSTQCWGADALTVNPYLGRDAVEPFIQSARRVEGGVFVLVRTSNPGARLFQDLDSGGRPLYEHVGEAVRRWARENIGDCGLGDIGAVVGATYPAELARLRQLLPEVIFLVPGYGAQGGSAADTAAAFRPDGLGAVVNSSRGILFPFDPADPVWEGKVTAAAQRAAAELGPFTRPR
jgi:orotidine-5'-phosphate decarboxylase